VVRAAGHANVRLLADTYHMAAAGEGPKEIRKYGGLLAHVHCAEAKGRGPLRAGGEDLRPHFRALKDIGYAGCVSLEPIWQDLSKQLAPAVAELRRQVEDA
jgi:sugar phosphate isomerase/epimerase